MKKFILGSTFLLAIVSLFVLGCTQTTSTTTTTTYPSATLTHWGFDFATGVQTDEAGKYDGEIIKWNPDAVTTTVEGTTYPSYLNYIWWRAAMPLDAVPHQKHLGAVELSSITTVPSTWDSGSLIMPLLANHAYVVKCSPEGYAKFKVTSVEVTPSWEADVQYYFTTEATFDQ